MRNAISKAIAGFLVSAPAAATPAEDMAAMLRKWEGLPAARMLEVWGEPDQRSERGRNTLYGYFGEGARPTLNTGGFTAIPGGRDGCIVIFEVDRRGTVARVSWSTEGAGNRARARKSCWREFRRFAPEG